MLLVLCFGFGLGALLCAMQYVLIRAGRFPRNPYFGLPGFSSSSHDDWARAQAQEAAKPWIGRAGILAALAASIAGIGSAVGAGKDPWDLYGVAAVVSGVIAVGVYGHGMNVAARRLAEEEAAAGSDRIEPHRGGASIASSGNNDTWDAAPVRFEGDGVLIEDLAVDRIARARELFEVGRHRAALEMLKPAAAAERFPFRQRRALAELYRELGYHDQAGRWGIVLDGWTTDVERDRLARLLAARDPSPRSVREFLSVPPGTATLALDALVRERVPSYRERFEAQAARQREQSPPLSAPAERAGDIGFGLGLAAALAALLGMAVVFVIALLGGEAQAAAGMAGLIVLLLAGLAFNSFGVSALVDRRVRAGITRVVLGLVLVGAVVAGFALLSTN